MDSDCQSDSSSDGTEKCPVAECNLPVDIVLRSSDKVLIGAHQANLARFSEGFPSPSDVKTTNEPVDLTEDGEIIQLLMGFMHLQRHPSLHYSDISTDSLFKLAEAAEKYLVYSAMNACHIRVEYDREVLSEDSARALNYAIKFNYLEVADHAALWTLPRWSLEEMVEAFGSGNGSRLLAWLHFREQYLELMHTILEGSSPSVFLHGFHYTCSQGHWDTFYKAVIADLPRTPAGFLSAVIKDGGHENPLGPLTSTHQSLLDSCTSSTCTTRAMNWQIDFWAALNAIQPFHTYFTSQ